jgi:Na+-transporting methylmalonyl-CoA/oxaloacetate decarboxylase gamma subunit
MMDTITMDTTTMAVVISMVFLTLLVLVIIFANIEKIIKTYQNNIIRKNLKPIFSPSAMGIKKSVKIEETSGEEFAAIAAAIYLYSNEMHDEENAILTIERSTRTSTPWSVKYYSMNNYFMRKSK